MASARYDVDVRTIGTVPIGKITFNPETRCYGFTFNFPGRRVHWEIETMESVKDALRWADPWGERIWEETSDADETAVLISTRKKAGAL